jgi:hypothetical protein
LPLAFARSASFVEQPGGTRGFGFTEPPKENRKSFGSEGDPNRRNRPASADTALRKANRQGFGFDGEPTGKTASFG